MVEAVEWVCEEVDPPAEEEVGSVVEEEAEEDGQVDMKVEERRWIM